jgi:hypothetical protein
VPTRPAKRCLAALAALALLAGCATSRLVSQQANPEYVGKSFKSVMVVAVTGDEVLRRTFEDRVVAHLGRRGIKGVQAYSVIGGRGRVEEAVLREAIARSSVEGAFGIGWGGFYGSYMGMWETVSVGPQTVSGPSWMASDTRLFDAKNGALAWIGRLESKKYDNLDAALTQYINLVFSAMVSDRVL